FYIYHVHNPEEFHTAVNRLNDNISIIIAKDEYENYDTLDIFEKYKNEPWFEDVSTLLVSEQKNVQRAQRAESIGINDYISAVSDINLLVAHELKLMIEIQKLKTLSNRDGLTGLYNHSAAEDIVFKTLHNNPDQEFLFAIIDLDYFKQVNDIKGHQFGDMVLKEESKRIRELFNDKSLAIRFGGDEFLFLTPLLGNVEDMAQTIYNKLHFTLRDYQVTNSIGISTTLYGKREFKPLLRLADKALYNAKANGRNQYCIYKEDLSEKLDGAEEELRNEVLNLDTSSIIHSLLNNYEEVYHLDLNKIAVTKLCKK
ncbi:MAG: diguanylate cyclase domain-containing protein, partial [Erysipelotrichaceae bacterium]